MTDWNALWRDAGHRFNCWPNEELVRWVSTLDRGSRVLEVGCGNGANLRALLSAGMDAVGCDIAEEALLAAAGLRTASQTILSSACELQFPTESFDAVCDVQCLQHLSIDELVRAYSEIHRVLKPGGRFFQVALILGEQHFPHLSFNLAAGCPVWLNDAGLKVFDEGLSVRERRGRRYGYTLVECVRV